MLEYRDLDAFEVLRDLCGRNGIDPVRATLDGSNKLNGVARRVIDLCSFYCHTMGLARKNIAEAIGLGRVRSDRRNEILDQCIQSGFEWHEELFRLANGGLIRGR